METLYQTCDDWVYHLVWILLLIVLGMFPEPARERHSRLQTVLEAVYYAIILGDRACASSI